MSDETLLGKGFEEWRNGYDWMGRNRSEIERDTYEAGYQQGQFDLNNALGLAANEAAKTARRKKLLKIISDLIDNENLSTTQEELDALIAEAQG